MDELVQVSVAIQVRVALKILGHRGVAAFVTVLTIVMVTLVPSQMSTAVGGLKSHVEPHSKIWLAAQLNAGGVVSTRVMLWLQVTEFEHKSDTVQVRVALKSLGHRGL